MSPKFNAHVNTQLYSALESESAAPAMEKHLPGDRDSTRRKAKPKNKHVPRRWTSPSTMIFCFTLGLVFAVGHHFYYRWLDGQVVGDLNRQQWSLRIGNFFAVATATMLKLAMANACLQYIWLRLRQKAHKLETIDAAFSMTGDIFPFFHADLWRKMYIGVILAILIWAIPIASIFPPATLSVVIDLHSNTSTFDALQPSILNPDPVNQYGRDTLETVSTAYQDAPDTFATLVKSVASVGQATAPHPLLSASNYSYTLNTYIPRFKCSADSDGTHTRIQDAAKELLSIAHNITSFNKDTFAYVNGEFAENGRPNDGNGLLFYLGVVPLSGPKIDADYLGTLGLPQSQVLIDTSTDNTDPYALLKGDIRDEISGSVLSAILTGPGQIEFTTCTLYNSSFETETSFSNGIGSTRVLSITDVTEMRNLSESLNIPTSYVHYFQEMSRLFVGSTIAEDTLLSFDDPNEEVFRMVLSTIPTESTVLAQASDFADMLSYRAEWVGNGTNGTPISQNKTFSTMLNELSVNVSLSLMSTPALCRTVSVTGTINSLSTVYQYQPLNLVISYGVAIACSLASIIVGLVAFSRNGESHDAKISTIGAMMQNPELASLLRRPVDELGDREQHELSRQIQLRLATYSMGETSGSNANDESAELRKRRFVGFVTGADRDGFRG